jgi:hypothetical protein
VAAALGGVVVLTAGAVLVLHLWRQQRAGSDASLLCGGFSRSPSLLAGGQHPEDPGVGPAELVGGAAYGGEGGVRARVAVSDPMPARTHAAVSSTAAAGTEASSNRTSKREGAQVARDLQFRT